MADLPRHHLIALARLQDAVERDEWRQMAQINEDIQGLADAFVGALHRAERRGREQALGNEFVRLSAELQARNAYAGDPDPGGTADVAQDRRPPWRSLRLIAGV